MYRRAAVLGLLVLPILGTWVGLALAAHFFTVARPGTSEEYWEHLCGVQLQSFHGHHQYSHSGATLTEVDGALYYYDQMHHEQILYSVPLDAVLRDATAVRAAVAEGDQQLPKSCREDGRDICELYWSGKAKREACQKVFESLGFVSSSNGLKALGEKVGDRGAYVKPEAQDRALLDRLRRGHRVWLTFLFEGLYLTAWWGFVFWKLLPFPRLFSWRWQVGLAPLLLFLPYFLGYAPMTFTYGPSGGFIYPVYLVFASLPMAIIPCTAADGFVGHLLPRPLSLLSQLPGAPSAYMFRECVGPVSSIVAGLAFVAVLSGFAFVWHWIRRRQFDRSSAS